MLWKLSQYASPGSDSNDRRTQSSNKIKNNFVKLQDEEEVWAVNPENNIVRIVTSEESNPPTEWLYNC